MSNADDAARSDEELFSGFRAGESDAIRPIFDRYEEHLRNFLTRRYNVDEHLLDDLVQHAFTVLCERQEPFDARHKVRPWLFSVAANAAINSLISKSKRKTRNFSAFNNPVADNRERDYDPQDASPDAQEISQSNERALRLRLAVQSLPAGDRDAIEAVYMQGLRHPEAADKLGIPLGSLKTRLHRSIRALRCRLDQGGEMTEAA